MGPIASTIAVILGVLVLVFHKAIVQDHEGFWLKHFGKRYSEGERDRLRMVGIVVGLVWIGAGLGELAGSCR